METMEIMETMENTMEVVPEVEVQVVEAAGLGTGTKVLIGVGVTALVGAAVYGVKKGVAFAKELKARKERKIAEFEIVEEPAESEE